MSILSDPSASRSKNSREAVSRSPRFAIQVRSVGRHALARGDAHHLVDETHDAHAIVQHSLRLRGTPGGASP